MIESESAGIRAEVSTALADLPVVPQASRASEQADADSGAEAGQRPRPVALERELALAGPKDRLDLLPYASQGAGAGCLVAPIGAPSAAQSK